MSRFPWRACGFPVQRGVLELRRTASGAMVTSRVEIDAPSPHDWFGDSGTGFVNAGTIAAGNYTIGATYDGIKHPPFAFIVGRCAE